MSATGEKPPEGEAPGRQKPGPRPSYLTDDQRSEFLNLLTDGFGINMAVAEMKISWEIFDRTRKVNRKFARQIDRARAHLKEKLVALRTSQAFRGDGRALEYCITRLDNGEQFEIRMQVEREKNGKGRDDVSGDVRTLDESEGEAASIVASRTAGPSSDDP